MKKYYCFYLYIYLNLFNFVFYNSITYGSDQNLKEMQDSQNKDQPKKKLDTGNQDSSNLNLNVSEADDLDIEEDLSIEEDSDIRASLNEQAIPNRSKVLLFDDDGDVIYSESEDDENYITDEDWIIEEMGITPAGEESLGQCFSQTSVSKQLEALENLLLRVKSLEHGENEDELKKRRDRLLSKLLIPVTDFNDQGRLITKIVPLADLVKNYSLLSKEAALALIRAKRDELIHLDEPLRPKKENDGNGILDQPDYRKMKNMTKNCWTDDFQFDEELTPEKLDQIFEYKTTKDGIICQNITIQKRIIRKILAEKLPNVRSKWEGQLNELREIARKIKLIPKNAQGPNCQFQDGDDVCVTDFIMKIVKKMNSFRLKNLQKNNIEKQNIIFKLRELYGHELGQLIEDQGQNYAALEGITPFTGIDPDYYQTAIAHEAISNLYSIKSNPFKTLERSVLGRHIAWRLVPSAVRQAVGDAQANRHNPLKEGSVQLGMGITRTLDSPNTTGKNIEVDHKYTDGQYKITVTDPKGDDEDRTLTEVAVTGNLASYNQALGDSDNGLFLYVMDQKTAFGTTIPGGDTDSYGLNLFSDGGYAGGEFSGSFSNDDQDFGGFNIAASISNRFSASYSSETGDTYCYEYDEDGNPTDVQMVRKKKVVEGGNGDEERITKKINVPFEKISILDHVEGDIKVDVGLPKFVNKNCPLGLTIRGGYQRHQDVGHNLCLPSDEVANLLKDGSDKSYDIKRKANLVTRGRALKERINNLPSQFDPLCCFEGNRRGLENAEKACKKNHKRLRNDKRFKVRKGEQKKQECIPLNPRESITYAVSSNIYGGAVGQLSLGGMGAVKAGIHAARSKNDINVEITRIDSTRVAVSMRTDKIYNFGIMAEIVTGAKSGTSTDWLWDKGLGGKYILDLSTSEGLDAYRKIVIEGRSPISIKKAAKNSDSTSKDTYKKFVEKVMNYNEVINGSKNPVEKMNQVFLKNKEGVKLVEFNVHELNTIKASKSCKSTILGALNKARKNVFRHKGTSAVTNPDDTGDKATNFAKKEYTVTLGKSKVLQMDSTGLKEEDVVLHSVTDTKFSSSNVTTRDTYGRVQYEHLDGRIEGEKVPKGFVVESTFSLSQVKDHDAIENYLLNKFSIPLHIEGDTDKKPEKGPLKSWKVTLKRKYSEQEINKFFKQLNLYVKEYGIDTLRTYATNKFEDIDALMSLIRGSKDIKNNIRDSLVKMQLTEILSDLSNTEDSDLELTIDKIIEQILYSKDQLNYPKDAKELKRRINLALDSKKLKKMLKKKKYDKFKEEITNKNTINQIWNNLFKKPKGRLIETTLTGSAKKNLFDRKLHEIMNPLYSDNDLKKYSRFPNPEQRRGDIYFKIGFLLNQLKDDPPIDAEDLRKKMIKMAKKKEKELDLDKDIRGLFEHQKNNNNSDKLARKLYNHFFGERIPGGFLTEKSGRYLEKLSQKNWFEIARSDEGLEMEQLSDIPSDHSSTTSVELAKNAIRKQIIEDLKNDPDGTPLWMKDESLRERFIESIVKDRYTTRVSLLQDFIRRTGDNGFSYIQQILDSTGMNSRGDLTNKFKTNNKIQVHFSAPWQYPVLKTLQFLNVVNNIESDQDRRKKAKTRKNAYNETFNRLEAYEYRKKAQYPQIINYSQTKKFKSWEKVGLNSTIPNPYIVQDKKADDTFRRMCCLKRLINDQLDNVIYRNKSQIKGDFTIQRLEIENRCKDDQLYRRLLENHCEKWPKN